MAQSNLPFGSVFAPAQIDLLVLLELAHEHAADWKAFGDAVRDSYFAGNKTTDYNKGKLANNTKLSMRAYGLIGEEDATLTETGRALYDIRADESGLYKVFARHILKDRQGMNLVQCLLDMWAAGEDIDLNKLRRWLYERGINVSRGGKHVSTMRLWLEKAGVFVSGYRVNQERLKVAQQLLVTQVLRRVHPHPTSLPQQLDLAVPGPAVQRRERYLQLSRRRILRHPPNALIHRVSLYRPRSLIQGGWRVRANLGARVMGTATCQGSMGVGEALGKALSAREQRSPARSASPMSGTSVRQGVGRNIPRCGLAHRR